MDTNLGSRRFRKEFNPNDKATWSTKPGQPRASNNEFQYDVKKGTAPAKNAPRPYYGEAGIVAQKPI
jgi:hypothetical protein